MDDASGVDSGAGWKETFQLCFEGQIPDVLFTYQKLLGVQGKLKVVLRDDSGGIVEDGPLAFMKVKLVVLSSDLNHNLTSDGLDQYILHPRTDRQPLLAGKSEFFLFKGVAYMDDVEFTDNSSWIRSRKFRLGAKAEKSVSPGGTVREAISEAFTVKDRRGVSYSKKETPALDDAVWRLSGISKDGKLHQRLSSIGINSVGNLLKYREEGKPPLNEILQVSSRRFKDIIEHASKASSIVKSDSDIHTSHRGQNTDELFEIFSLNISQECLDCLVIYCSLFPKDYEIDGDTLIQLWMAEDLIKEEPMEDIAAVYLKALCENKKCISMLREDCGTCKIWYKINGFEPTKQELQRSKITPIRVISDYDHTKTEYVHLSLQRLYPRDLKVLARFTKMRSLLLLQNHKADIKHFPSDFFMSLRNLRTLDLSRTKASELPSCIGNAKSLRYLDLSETLIKKLPETIEFLDNLQTLKLKNCPSLVSLPKSIKRLKSLRHLDLGILHRIHSMPDGMGQLLELRTLSEFIVGREGSSIGELKKMNHLKGKLCLSRLENVASIEDAHQVLSGKQQLKSLELQWTHEDIHQESINIIDNVLDYLQPHENLQCLRILCYGGSTFPRWISSQLSVKLTKITLFKCAKCMWLPSLGQLPSLESLSIIELTSVHSIGSEFVQDEASTTAGTTFTIGFPALQQLQIRSMLNLELWKGGKEHNFPRLKKLSIKDCPRLFGIFMRGSMTSLEHLELNQCRRLTRFSSIELIASLETLVIDDCPSFRLPGYRDMMDRLIKIQHSSRCFIYQSKKEDKREEIVDSTERGGPSIANTDRMFPPFRLENIDHVCQNENYDQGMERERWRQLRCIKESALKSPRLEKE
ncbi:unnamed protein product [Amaranthus hypochondriacus]